MQHFLGVDAGGTKCRARLVDVYGQTLGEGVAGPSNLRFGAIAVASQITTACLAAVAAAGLDATILSQCQAGLGIAGFSRAGNLDDLLPLLPEFGSVKITSDGYVALLGAHSGSDGGVIIVGTGSIGLGQRGANLFRVGGYGFPISDQGSGADIGLSAVRLMLQAHDGLIARTPLTDAVMDSFGGAPAQVIQWMDTATPTHYATLAPLVTQQASRGDPLARSIMLKAAVEVGRMVETVMARGAPVCSLLGGLSQEVQGWMSSDLRQRLKPPDGDGVQGAVLLAQKAGPNGVIFG
ncbi:hypothetical protein CHU95_00365 [Niveispirillum lacus]|uniref:ATPase BadF/BadG/BcrA/BcrD type domain-containing protein n=1 Tax=Niveispirillum lacus TaxID=1981099 RepID=A0A255Z8M6_9PROT|nr:BadF/BadG/BcrA/BcrD ATPase family protein [Niveispirillum lacus]OYQ37799.1 hypothetical protein CHU95_00365 [Niveispirillum lacus]